MKIAINGFGRIGRSFFKILFDEALREDSKVEIVAINDLTEEENLAYLLQYDSVYGLFDREIEVEDRKDKVGDVEATGVLRVEGEEILSFSEKDPKKLPWDELDVDVVLESTGVFTEKEAASQHLEAGASRVVVSAPCDGNDEGQVLVGVDDDKFESGDLPKVTNNASCTTNAVAAPLEILKEELGVKKAILNTTHAMTSSQAVVDGPSSKTRRGRAASENIIPTSTGSAVATTKSLESLEGKFDGIAMRVPVPAGSIADITFVADQDTTVDEINNIFVEASQEERWQGVLAVTEDPVVSSDIIGAPFAALIDADMTRVIDGNLVKVLSWYDNEWGYCATLVEHVLRVGELV